MKLSIIIPVYNEAEHLGNCLNAIEQLSVKPHEVIVVDNNSTDNTIEIATKYSFVTVLREQRQGVVHARNRGFNYASGDILGRIDADTMVTANWANELARIFADDSIDAVSGAVTYYDMPFTVTTARLDLYFRQHIASNMDQEMFLFGANMALRRSTWQQVKSRVCNKGDIHEDFDLAIHTYDLGAKVVFDDRLVAGVSLRRIDATSREFAKYAMISPRTYAKHGRDKQRSMYPAVGLVICFHWLIKLLHLGYQPSTGGFSFIKLWNNLPSARVNPATFVD